MELYYCQKCGHKEVTFKEEYTMWSCDLCGYEVYHEECLNTEPPRYKIIDGLENARSLVKEYCVQDIRSTEDDDLLLEKIKVWAERLQKSRHHGWSACDVLDRSNPKVKHIIKNIPEPIGGHNMYKGQHDGEIVNENIY